MTDQPQKKRQLNKWLSLVNIPIQMGLIVFLFAWIGEALDRRYPNENNWFVKGMVLLGVAVAFYNINRQLKVLNKDE